MREPPPIPQGVGKSGNPSHLDCEDRRFKSSRPDQESDACTCPSCTVEMTGRTLKGFSTADGTFETEREAQLYAQVASLTKLVASQYSQITDREKALRAAQSELLAKDYIIKALTNRLANFGG